MNAYLCKIESLYMVMAVETTLDQFEFAQALAQDLEVEVSVAEIPGATIDDLKSALDSSPDYSLMTRLDDDGIYYAEELCPGGRAWCWQQVDSPLFSQCHPPGTRYEDVRPADLDEEYADA